MQTSFVGVAVTAVAQITGGIKSQALGDGKQSDDRSFVASIFVNFVAGGDARASTRPDPEPQAKGNHDHGTDAAEPKGCEPQQAPLQWLRLLLRRLQWYPLPALTLPRKTQ
jgi:hypothetical protein